MPRIFADTNVLFPFLGLGYSLQAMAKTAEGNQHPDRDALEQIGHHRRTRRMRGPSHAFRPRWPSPAQQPPRATGWILGG